MDSNSKSENNQMALVVAECPGAELYRLINNSRAKISEGSVKLAQFQESKTYFINVDKFCSNIIPGTPFVYILSPKGLSLLFPHMDQGLNGVFLAQSEQMEYFQTQLGNVTQLVPFDQAMSIDQFKTTIEYHCKDIQQVPLNESNKAIGYINKGGEMLKQGFSWLGSAIATGINKGGQFISSKIDSGESQEVPDERKNQLQNVKSKVGGWVSVTGDFLNQLYQPVAKKTRELSDEVAQKIDNSDNKILKQTKQLSVATWDATGSALSGLGEALSQVGSSIGTNTRVIVEKKYGKDVAQTYLGGDDAKQQQQQDDFIEMKNEASVNNQEQANQKE